MKKEESDPDSCSQINVKAKKVSSATIKRRAAAA